MPNSHGQFAWHELITTDPEAAKAFYPQITPWKVQPMEDMDDYWLWLNDETPIGGLMPLPKSLETLGVPPYWLPYVRVYDLDECVRQVKTLGGQVRMEPKEVPNVGCWAVIADPQGGVIGVYEPVAAPAPRAGLPRRGEFSWHELLATEYKAAFEFYRALFRWEKIQEHDMGPMGIYFIFGQKSQTYGGMFNKPPEIPSPYWLSYIRGDDVTQAAAKVKQLGGKVMLEPMEVPGGDWIVQCSDVQGAMFAVHKPKTP